MSLVDVENVDYEGWEEPFWTEEEVWSLEED